MVAQSLYEASGADSGEGRGWLETSGLMYSGLATRETIIENIVSNHLSRWQVTPIR
jgi:hypothetical protein